MTVLNTARLRLRPLAERDVDFILTLLNDADWLRFIGDRDVHTPEQALDYIHTRSIQPLQNGIYGFYAVTLRNDDAPMGICGLLNRDTLPAPDVGYAFLPTARGHGYAREAAAAALALGFAQPDITRILAIVSPGNERSLRLLANLGMRRQGVIRQGDEDLLLLEAQRP